MDFSEEELEDWLYENPDEVDFVDRWIARQLELPSGRLDLLGVVGNIPVVVEVKREAIKASALTQVTRYAADIAQVLNYDYEVQKICVGTGGVSNQLLFEAQALDIELYTVECHFQVGGPWAFTKEATLRHEKARDELRSRLPLLLLVLQRETIDTLRRMVNSALPDEKLRLASCIAAELGWNYFSDSIIERLRERTEHAEDTHN